MGARSETAFSTMNSLMTEISADLTNSAFEEELWALVVGDVESQRDSAARFQVQVIDPIDDVSHLIKS